MALAYGLDLLGTIAKPVTVARLQTLIENYVPPQQRSERAPRGPSFSFSEIGIGLQARQFEPFFQPKIELETGQVKGRKRSRAGPSGARRAGADGVHRRARAAQPHRLPRLEHDREVGRGLPRVPGPGHPDSDFDQPGAGNAGAPDFIQQMSACVDRHRVMPEYVTFEMPESSVLTTDPNFVERLVRLRMVGYGLAIDDSAPGRSNLQLLARMPFSELKIDRSFVNGASKKRAWARCSVHAWGWRAAWTGCRWRWAWRPGRTGISCRASVVPMRRVTISPGRWRQTPSRAGWKIGGSFSKR